MVKVNNKFTYLDNGNLDLEQWLSLIQLRYTSEELKLIKSTIQLAADTSKGLTTFYGQTCLEQGLEMGEIIAGLQLDADAVAAAILTSTFSHTQLTSTIISDATSSNVSKLINGISQLNILNSLAQTTSTKNQTQLDRLRKAFLAIASDIRVILIKLAERTSVMRGIKNINLNERKRIAQETMNIYAPLANRLGIGSLKWELEDLAFHYIDPVMYKTIANYLAERRVERQQRIEHIILQLKSNLQQLNINAEITGRAKHIYSIYLKMQRKRLNLKDIYDYSAIRILVPNISDCYSALSIVHNLWDHILEEFDDYIIKPKSNGYRSIHTAVTDETNKTFEIQIRTYDMHMEAEHGVAAHWIYKENKPQQTGYEAKITLLRHLLEWHKDLTKSTSSPEKQLEKILEDNIYVFTPTGEIIELTIGSTPLDFAYHIHTALGHRCRGAKINGHIVPLTYSLKTGDQVEIITIKNGTPSRDWLRKDANYVKSTRARAKIAQWFKLQDQDQYYEIGKQILERELVRTPHSSLPLDTIAEKLKFKDDKSLLTALGRGSVRAAQIVHALDNKMPSPSSSIVNLLKPNEKPRSFQVGNLQDLLTRVSLCCKPLPGDEIIGYITQGRGVSIHKKDCKNIIHAKATKENRIIEVSWDETHAGGYYADIQINAYGREQIIKEITSLLANAKIDLLKLNSTINKIDNIISIIMTIQIHNLEKLNQLITQVKHLSQVIDVKRIRV